MENVLTVYLGGAMDGVSVSDRKAWRRAIAEAWPDCLDPTRRDFRGKDHTHFREIVELDKHDIRNSDVLLVRYLKPSVGTCMEVLYAWEHDKFILIWCDKETYLSPWLLYHNTAIVHTMEEVLDKLDDWSLA